MTKIAATMKTTEVDKKSLEELQRKAVDKAVRENKALKLSYVIVENGSLIQVSADGQRTVLRDAKFGTVKVQQKTIKLKKV